MWRKKLKKKKPTMKEIERVVSRLIVENQFLGKRQSSTEILIEEYIDWKKDTKKFKTYMEKKYAKPKKDKSKDRA